ncbi:MAG: hypothetical protein IPK17_26435 [Chloroflexi bacterium]|uniref:hypothetical protein n=1 Tax=Candidatus Flexifilum breve TaxID=3140694 RepID=UPI0031372B9A|nr:hypothetical protein [Chloroflexota bacterium]
MDKTIATALLIVISIIMAVMLFNIAYPAIVDGGNAIGDMASRAEDQMRTQVNIIHATGELDGAGNWVDTNSNSTFDIFVWVKNVGDTRITALERMDVFLWTENYFQHLPYGSGGGAPYWTYSFENDDDWVPTATLRLTISFSGQLVADRYNIRLTLPNGITEDTTLGM